MQHWNEVVKLRAELKKTHERNVLVWLAANWGWLVPISWIVLSAVLLFGCATKPTPLPTVKELRVRELVTCHDKRIRVSFFDKTYMVKVDWLCDENKEDCEMAPAAGKAYLPSRHVGFHRPWVEETTEHRWVVAHEVCHVMLMLWDENKTTNCARLIWKNCE
jgi:hypothetical protein